jgi:predicted DsbA family dithiol-disulfide isomerase
LTYAPQKMTRQPNTIDCHRLILWARNGADPAQVKQRLMDLYFAEGADLSDREVLVQAAKDCGMDGDLVLRLLASEDDVARVTSEANTAKDAGIDGVPTFIFDSSLLLTGAQPPDFLATAIARAAAGQQTKATA